MKKEITTIVLVSFVSFMKAQSVGIGTATPDASTKLQIEDTQRGVLIPKVLLTSVTTFGLAGNTQTEGILVYNVNASATGGNGKGFYYWDGTKWVSLKSKKDDLIFTVDGF